MITISKEKCEEALAELPNKFFYVIKYDQLTGISDNGKQKHKMYVMALVKESDYIFKSSIFGSTRLDIYREKYNPLFGYGGNIIKSIYYVTS